MKWQKLTSLKNVALGHGAIIRTPGKWPHEDIVDLMVFDAQDAGRMGLIVDSGYKAGLMLCVFPPESTAGQPHSVLSGWLRKNWRKWVYESSSSAVAVCRKGRPKPRPPKLSD